MELLTVSNAAARLHCSEGTVRRWATSGRLRIFVRLADGSRLFRESDVLALLDQKGAHASPPRNRIERAPR